MSHEDVEGVVRWESASTTEIHSKKEICNTILRMDGCAVHLDPRVDGVAVPERFKEQAHLALHIGIAMIPRIPDLLVTDEGITATLTFAGEDFPCVIPWRAVFGLSMIRQPDYGRMWEDEFPAEVRAKVAAAKHADTVLQLHRGKPGEC